MAPDATAAVRQADIGFLFSVSVTGMVTLGEFMAIEPITLSREPLVYHEGGRGHGPHVLYGPLQRTELVLRWGLMDRTALLTWFREVQLGTLFKKSGAIYQYPRQAGAPPLRVYGFAGAWPIGWTGPRLDAMSSEVPVEELRLAVDYLTISGGAR